MKLRRTICLFPLLVGGCLSGAPNPDTTLSEPDEASRVAAMQASTELLSELARIQMDQLTWASEFVVDNTATTSSRFSEPDYQIRCALQSGSREAANEVQVQSTWGGCANRSGTLAFSYQLRESNATAETVFAGYELGQMHWDGTANAVLDFAIQNAGVRVDIALTGVDVWGEQNTLQGTISFTHDIADTGLRLSGRLGLTGADGMETELLLEDIVFGVAGCQAAPSGGTVVYRAWGHTLSQHWEGCGDTVFTGDSGLAETLEGADAGYIWSGATSGWQRILGVAMPRVLVLLPGWHLAPEPVDTSPDPDADPDKDGLTNAEEAALGTDPNKADTDEDGFSDGDEKNFWQSDALDPNVPLLIGSEGSLVGLLYDDTSAGAAIDGLQQALRPAMVLLPGDLAYTGGSAVAVWPDVCSWDPGLLTTWHAGPDFLVIDHALGSGQDVYRWEVDGNFVLLFDVLDESVGTRFVRVDESTVSACEKVEWDAAAYATATTENPTGYVVAVTTGGDATVAEYTLVRAADDSLVTTAVDGVLLGAALQATTAVIVEAETSQGLVFEAGFCLDRTAYEWTADQAIVTPYSATHYIVGKGLRDRSDSYYLDVVTGETVYVDLDAMRSGNLVLWPDLDASRTVAATYLADVPYRAAIGPAPAAETIRIAVGGVYDPAQACSNGYSLAVTKE